MSAEDGCHYPHLTAKTCPGCAPAPMRALTVQQPWAWAIVHGGKDVENRTQAWKYRGPLAIHAGARLSERGCRLVPDLLDQTQGSTDLLWRYAMAELDYGAVIGVVDLVGVHTADWCWEPEGLCSPWAEASYDEHDGGVRHDVVHLVLENPRPLATPIPAKGRLGLWTPDPHLLAQIREQVPA
jgi:hypothetical protein